jgi:hypothetical protein
MQLSYDEHVLMQERELEKLMKRTAASRNALIRNQANKMTLLEQALKGWFNPKKVCISLKGFLAVDMDFGRSCP